MKKATSVARASLFALAFGLAQQGLAGTPNTTATGAVSYQVGQGWMSFSIDETTQMRWLTFVEYGARSYCLEATVGSATHVPLDPSLALFSDIYGTTQISTNADGVAEPASNRGSRICYISALAAGASAARAVRVYVPITAASGDSGYVKARVVDTTQFAAQWQRVLKGDPNFPTVDSSSTFMIANTGSTSVNVQLLLSGPGDNASGFPYSSSAFTLAGNAKVQISTSNTALWTGGLATLVMAASGHAVLLTDAPPGALTAQVQTSNVTSGLRWTDSFTPRRH